MRFGFLLMAVASLLPAQTGMSKLVLLYPDTTFAFPGLPTQDVHITAVQTFQGKPGVTVQIIEGRGDRCEIESKTLLTVSANQIWHRRRLAVRPHQNVCGHAIGSAAVGGASIILFYAVEPSRR